MTFEETKELMKSQYVAAGLPLVDEHQRELFFGVMDVRANVHLSEDEIEAFRAFEEKRATYEARPAECAICSRDYREQIVEPMDEFHRRIFLSQDREYTFGTVADDQTYVKVGPASVDFVNYFRFHDSYLQYSVERMHRRRRFRVEVRMAEFWDALYKPLTIKVFNIAATSIDSALTSSSALIDSCLFHLAYMRNIALSLLELWPWSQPQSRPFRFGDSAQGNDFDLPRVFFNADTVRFYLRGCGTDDPINTFLSYYQVLEYYFVRIADEKLYDQLARRINDPKFAAVPKHLDGVVRDTLQHRTETDETEMLKLVLSKFVDESDVVEFIKAYEAYIQDNIYTKKRSIFGQDYEVKLNPGHVLGNVAKRIKAIRNALVHSSDRHERRERYIPTRRSEDMIRRETPLLKHLAERVIVAAAS